MSTKTKAQLIEENKALKEEIRDFTLKDRQDVNIDKFVKERSEFKQELKRHGRIIKKYNLQRFFA